MLWHQKINVLQKLPTAIHFQWEPVTKGSHCCGSSKKRNTDTHSSNFRLILTFCKSVVTCKTATECTLEIRAVIQSCYVSWNPLGLLNTLIIPDADSNFVIYLFNILKKAKYILIGFHYQEFQFLLLLNGGFLIDYSALWYIGAIFLFFLWDDGTKCDYTSRREWFVLYQYDAMCFNGLGKK